MLNVLLFLSSIISGLAAVTLFFLAIRLRMGPISAYNANRLISENPWRALSGYTKDLPYVGTGITQAGQKIVTKNGKKVRVAQSQLTDNAVRSSLYSKY